ncbi:hypothetical protein B0J13DRAFT_547694 [Dactylonectria estremocensis]|uniref:Uncharacterized protein n=1 Tax=Dactylonectria estremocensis TaxID=1079267 RepID=A0A9P9F399_9HYPO|nr:hypothetical protein B0J13DRAFT_547694 [Dactylonectria estremocensis]
MDRIIGWPLLGIVAERFGLQDVTRDVEQAITLSYRGDGSSIIDQAREWFTPGQWKAFHNLDIMSMLLFLQLFREVFLTDVSIGEKLMRQYRQMQLDLIFHSIHLLVDQLMNFEAGILPNKSLFSTWRDRHVAPCHECVTLPMNTLLRALMAEHLWPLYPKSYQGSVNDLLDALHEVERTMGMDELEQCNQFSHLMEHLDHTVVGVVESTAR